MTSFFREKSAAMLGIDIGSASVKLLELAKNSEHYTVQAYATLPLPEHAMRNNLIRDTQAVGSAIKQLLQKSGTRLRRAAVAVAASTVITKTIALPAALSAAEIEACVEMEAEAQMPYPLAEIAIDFCLKGAAANTPDTMEAWLVACRLEDLAPRCEALAIAGLEAAVVDVEHYAMQRAFEHRPQTAGEPDPRAQVVAIVDLGATVTHFIVLAHGELVFAKEQEFGGAQLALSIHEHYGISLQEVGLNAVEDSLPGDCEERVLAPFKEVVVRQLAGVLQLFFASSPLKQVDRIVLAGGTALITGLADQVQAQLDVPACIANPLAAMRMAPGAGGDRARHAAPALMVACGLALRSFR